MTQTLAMQVRKAAKKLKCGIEEFFRKAYAWMYGKARGIHNEARRASQRCLGEGTFCERALAAIRGFLSFELEWDPAPA